ncbi:ATP-binding protein [Actinocorallia sp. A-T 12471]|uniref:ATP-binding protein n=1 Tax=Actinocorallia sp. A-T 12471 TaxID=3089813 RepID=UPI0029D389DA|nr:ATP-binding protein [Actinocorallia sp. A-T 12471]MDX6742383.1 ATP-binding protein [Actinocorallia sp. A-T 12471]
MGATRARCRRLLVGCEVLGDLLVVVSELLGNAVRHGTVPVSVVLTLWHEGGSLRGEVRHPIGEGAGRPATPVGVLAERAALDAGSPVAVDDLAEGGRGLMVVRGYTAAVTQTTTSGVLATVWRHGPCGCVRAVS